MPPVLLTGRPASLLPVPPEDATRREFITRSAAVAAAMAFLAACGDGDAEPTREASPTTRMIDHFGGTTEVPARAERIVATSATIVAATLLLGIRPAAIPGDSGDYLNHLLEALPVGTDPASFTTSGGDHEPDLEILASLQPDLILATEWDVALYESLGAIAPTVLLHWPYNGNWRDRFLATAEATGRIDEGRAVEAEYEAFLDALPAELRSNTIAFIRAEGEGTFLVDSTPEAFAGSVAIDADVSILVPPAGLGEAEYGYVRLSNELLPVVEDADLIVVQDSASANLAALEKNPLWERLPAVQAGRVLPVPNPIYNGGSHASARLLLTRIVAGLGLGV